MRDSRLRRSLVRALSQWLFCLTQPDLRRAFGEPNWRPTWRHWLLIDPVPDGRIVDEPARHCGFCGKSQYEVRALIVGRSSNICDRCARECADETEWVVARDITMPAVLRDLRRICGETPPGTGGAP